MTHKILQTFKANMLSFLDELLEIFPDDSQLYSYRFFISDKIPLHDLMNKFRQEVLPYEEDIDSRNESFFLESSTIFPDDDKDKFKEMWESGDLDQQDKDTVWAYFDVFVELAHRYENSM